MRKQYLQPNTGVSPITLIGLICGSPEGFNKSATGGDPINEGV